MATGECNCGAVAFEISAEISDVYVCHCSICRRATGANGIAVIVVPNEAFSWLRGREAIASWRKPDMDWETWFCRHCGSRVPGINDASRMFVPAGLLTTGAETLSVAHHIFVDSKACWDTIADDGQQHSGHIGG